MASFKIISDITDEEVIAIGNSIRDLPRLHKFYSSGCQLIHLGST